MRRFFWTLSSAHLIVLCLVCLASAQSRRLNLLLVTIDTLRADHIGCYGYPHIKTPVLDALAREGVLFERVFSPVPLTLPAHCSILTGTYPSFHGVRDNSGFILPPEQVTLAEVLKPARYRTAGFIGAFVLDSKFGLAQGFDYYHDKFDLSRYENVSPGYIQRTGDEVARETVRWLDSQKIDAGPFFAWVHLYDPHDPYTPPEPYYSRHSTNPYDGEIEFTDANLGILLDWLRRNRLYENTLVVVIGDHGESLGEHGESKHGFFAYNATLHVPLIIRFPGAANAGRIVRESISSIDVFPTILQILDIGRPEAARAQGRGVLSLMLGKAAGYRPEIYAECYYPRLQFGWSEIRMLITDQYKYIQVPQPELYDYKRDFAETRNLAAEKSALANQLRDSLKNVVRRYSAASASQAGKINMDPETREKLRSLGYISYSMGDSIQDSSRQLRDPKNEIGTYNEITDLFEVAAKGEYRTVIPRYERILKEQPGLKIVHFKLGQAYFHTGNYEPALASYKKAIELGGEVALATYDMALTYLKLGRIDDAMLGLRQTIQMDPAHYRARTNLGVLLKERGKFQEAIGQLEAAIAQAPLSTIALNNLAISYSMTGRHQDAERTIRKAVELSPKDGFLRANLAAVLQRMGRLEEARQEMEQARKLNPRIGRP